MLSKRAKYGLKALLALSRQRQRGPVPIAELATSEQVPRKFLEQILVELRNQGIVQSQRGPGGGYSLRQAPEQVTLARVVRLFDGPLAPVPCASLHFYQPCTDCRDERSCGVRLVMREVRDSTARILEGTTLADLVAKVERERAATVRSQKSEQARRRRRARSS
jgi:Rrf2 family protein